MRMDQLEYLIEISKNRSLNAAAKKLHISQQALSISIKTLEDELGFEVLYRSYQGVTLTPKGAQLVKMTINYLDKAEELPSPAYCTLKRQRYCLFLLHRQDFFLSSSAAALLRRSTPFSLIRTIRFHHGSYPGCLL